MKKMNTLKIAAWAIVMGGSITGCSILANNSEVIKVNESAIAMESFEVSGDFDTPAPENYPFIAAEDFQVAFDELYEEASWIDATNMTYDQIVEIFGAPGVYYPDKDYEDGSFKYYKWFSDDGKDVVICFKAETMTFFSWASSTMAPSEKGE